MQINLCKISKITTLRYSPLPPAPSPAGEGELNTSSNNLAH